MIPYSKFAPSSFDSHIAIDDREDWFVVPCVCNRDSNCLDESNFHTALKELGGESETVEVHRFGHWACGWFEIIIVKPETAAYVKAVAIEASLANYPVLDEIDFSERETEEANRVWRDCYSVAERIKYIRENRKEFEFHSFADMLGCVRGKYFAGYASELLSE